MTENMDRLTREIAGIKEKIHSFLTQSKSKWPKIVINSYFYILFLNLCMGFVFLPAKLAFLPAFFALSPALIRSFTSLFSLFYQQKFALSPAKVRSFTSKVFCNYMVLKAYFNSKVVANRL